MPEPQRSRGTSGEVDGIRSQERDDGGLEEVEEVSCHAADDAVLSFLFDLMDCIVMLCVMAWRCGGVAAYMRSASFVVDATAEYEFYKNARAFMQVNNVFDEVYIASRRPSGLRPGAPRMVWGGLKYSF